MPGVGDSQLQLQAEPRLLGTQTTHPGVAVMCGSECHLYVCLYVSVCVVRPHLGGHFRALDQTCEDVFSCEDFYQVLGKSGRFFARAFFLVLGKCMCFFVSPRNSIKTCMCVSVCVCRFQHLPTS